MEQLAYMDYNATAPVRPGVAEAMAAALASVGNPSSPHGWGRRARALLDESREVVAHLLRVDPARVIFTSGGSEANHLALTSGGFRRVLVSAVEHASVRQALLPSPIEREMIPVDGHGVVDLDALAEMLSCGVEPALVSVMLANNETGVIQPIGQISELCSRLGAVVHCDAVQAAGKVPLDMDDLGVQYLSISAHKLGGPQGVGALAVDDRLDFSPLLRGGGQERGRRAGTENVPGIAGFAAAAAVAEPQPQETARLAGLRDGLEATLRRIAPELTIFGGEVERLANTSCLTMPGVAADSQLMALDLAGVMVSAGAACSSGKIANSPVLRAMGVAADEAACAIRVSLGWQSSQDHVERLVAAWQNLWRRHGHGGGRMAAPAA